MKDECAAFVQHLTVYDGAAFTVSEGVAEGDALSFADELVLDDTYQLDQHARPARLTLALDPASAFIVAADSTLGQSGNRLHLDCCITLMAQDGSTCEALVLVEVEAQSVAAIYLKPLATLVPREDYRLVGIDREAAPARFAEPACLSFLGGTHITLATGIQIRVEDLRAGDMVLTRDDGPQPLQWIGRRTIRATGAGAPVVIRRGVLQNENDLVVSPDHRLFVWQREDRLGAGRSEVLIKARHLINGDTIYQRDGGFIDYYQLLFDDHQIIYAEGIAAESMRVDARTRAALPQDLRTRFADGLSHRLWVYDRYDLTDELFTRQAASALIRGAT